MKRKHPLVILHGWNLSSDRYKPLTSEFKKLGYQVYSPDLPGFGQSQMAGKSFYLDDYVHFLRVYLEKRKIIKPVVIGHSFGGRIAIKLATSEKSLLSALILSGTPGVRPVGSGKRLLYLSAAKAGGLIFSLPIFKPLREIMKKSLYRVSGANDFYRTKPELKETFKNIVAEELSVLLPEVKIPTLLIWGRHDKIVPLSVAEKMLRRLPKGRLAVVDGARHGVPWSHVPDFAGEADRFIKENA